MRNGWKKYGGFDLICGSVDLLHEKITNLVKILPAVLKESHVLRQASLVSKLLALASQPPYTNSTQS